MPPLGLLRCSSAAPAARAAWMNRRSLRGSLRPLPGAVSTPVETSTPQGRTRRIASATFSGVSPPASRRRTPSNAPLTWHQSNTRPEPGLGASRSTMSAGPSEAIGAAGGEDESERVGAERDREERVLLRRDAADLDEHRLSPLRRVAFAAPP